MKKFKKQIKVNLLKEQTSQQNASYKNQKEGSNYKIQKSLYQADTKWILRDVNIKTDTCLSSNEKTKVFRGFKKTNSDNFVFKSVLIYKRYIKQYQQILRKAQKYYECYKGSTIDAPTIPAYTSTKFTASTSTSSQKQTYLKFIRPYFSGCNFHQQIYVHSKHSYENDQLQTFSQQCLNALSYDLGGSFYIPTLDNIYFDSTQIIVNCTSFETLMFLKHKTQHLPVGNFKHLYTLLPSKIEVFTDWQLMEEYLRQQIKLKAFFQMLFCFMTKRTPFQMISKQQICQQQLQWINILNTQNLKDNQTTFQTDFSGGNNQTQTFTMVQPNLISRLIKQIPKRWQQLLNNQQNKICLSQYSRYNHTQQNSQQNDTPQGKALPQGKDQYFYNLFHKIFVKEEKFGFKQLLQEKNIFRKLQKKSFKNNDLKQQQKLILQKRRSQKLQVAKVAFIYLHKYFLYKDIVQMELNEKQAKQYAKHLHFQTYLPVKLGLRLQATLPYEQWFQIFFPQSQDHRTIVFRVAGQLLNLVDKESTKMLKAVKGLKLYHIKRIAYIMGTKLKENKGQNLIMKELQKQISQFISTNRPYELTLQIINKQLFFLAGNQEQRPTIHQVRNALEDVYTKQIYPDLIPLFLAYIHQHALQTQVSQIQNAQWIIPQIVESKKDLDKIRGSVKLNPIHFGANDN